jgi:hypothetical protein
MLVAVAEVAINRLAVEALRPSGPPIPSWHAALSYVGLFLYYFASTLAAGALAVRAIDDLVLARREPLIQLRVLPRAIALGSLAAVGAFAIATAPSDFTSYLLETLFAIAVVITVGTAVRSSTDLGASIGILLLASPLVVHYYGTVFKHSILSAEAAADSDLPETVQRYGLYALCIAALASPYCFAPRPIVRSLPRPVPLIVGLIVLTVGAAIVRLRFLIASFFSLHGLGIDLGVGLAPGQMALYLLALATLAWTITSCALAEAEPRRAVGLGLGLCVLGGYGFAWPLAFLLGAAGLVVIGDALPRLGPAEGAAGARTPPIDDAAWQAYVSGLTAALRTDGAKVSAVTARGEDDLQSTIIVTERRGVAIKARLERVGGSLLCVDVVCGKEAAESKPVALTVAARGEGWMAPGSHPEPPPAAPPIRTGDEAFDRRFRCKGDGQAMYTLLDDGLRARAAASLDGWLAYWPGTGLRWRLYPGLGAPLDHPVPVSDLVLKRAASGAADRLAQVIELVAEIAARGDVPTQEPEPSADTDAASEPEPAA